jgi:anti-sigma B factor antagonist
MPVEFAVNPQTENGLLVVEVAGEIDLFTAPELKNAITDGIDAGSEKVVIDLSKTTFLDSTALGVLLGAVKRLRANDGSLAIVNSDENIAKTFEITGLDQILSIYATRAEAVKAL